MKSSVYRFLLALTLTLVGVVPASAQQIASVRPTVSPATSLSTASSGTCLYTTDCVRINVGGYKSIAFQVTGTWSGTFTIETSIDGATWVTQNMFPSTGTQTAVTTVTGNGIWWASPVMAAQFRLRFSTATSGTAVVTLRTTL